MAEFLSSSALSINCYDKNEKLVLDLINGRNYLEFENGLRKYVNNGNKLKLHLKIQDCLKDSSIVFITVPTPSNNDGSFSNKYIIKVLNEISIYIKKNKRENPYLININSTVSPSSINKDFIPYLEKKGLKNNIDFALIYNPYFVALGDVIKGLENPDLVLIGCENNYAKKKILELYNTIYDFDKYTILKFEEAEITKLLVNSYLTLKISFSNMVKDLSEKLYNVNSKKILNAIGSDSRIGKKYMQPGGPYAGPCFPRDNQALINFSKSVNYKNELNKGIVKTNQLTLENLKSQLDIIKEKNFSSIFFAGIGYKPNTPSLESSFILELMKYCKKINLSFYYYDRYIDEKIELGKRALELENFKKYSDIIFLPYIDRQFNKINNKKGIIWDIWCQIEGPNVIRNTREIELNKKSNLFYLKSI